jgi:hypothetical protein
MRSPVTETDLLLVTLFGAAVLLAQPAAAAGLYCPNPDHETPGKVPPGLIGAVATTFEIDNDSVRNAAFVRCVGPKLMGCYIGANLDCDKAETNRSLPGATAWCHDNPGSKIIPMSVTGHDTIYEWSCKRHRAIAGKAVVTVDLLGYIADNWREIR